LLQILFIAASDIKTRDVPTVSSIFVANFYVLEGMPTVCFALVVPWAKAGPEKDAYEKLAHRILEYQVCA
jgi:hypothetical protein